MIEQNSVSVSLVIPASIHWYQAHKMAVNDYSITGGFVGSALVTAILWNRAHTVNREFDDMNSIQVFMSS